MGKFAKETIEDLQDDALALQVAASASMHEFQRQLGGWAAATFIQATDKSILAHLRREIKELEGALKRIPNLSKHVNVAEEVADCIMLLMHIASRYNVNVGMALWRKFLMNKKRKWGKPDKQGVVEHL